MCGVWVGLSLLMWIIGALFYFDHPWIALLIVLAVASIGGVLLAATAKS